MAPLLSDCFKTATWCMLNLVRFISATMQSEFRPWQSVIRTPRPLGITTLRAAVSRRNRAAQPGIPAAEIEAPALDILRSEGLPDTFAMRFGYCVGIGYPPTWLEPFGITRTNLDPVLPGMTFVLHACLLDEEHRIGVLLGGTYLMDEDGLVQLAGAGVGEP
ncbi:MAG: hypothetical protein R3D32_13185 [Nitratireductor sp.]